MQIGRLDLSQFTCLLYRVTHVPASSSIGRSKVPSAVWSATQVLEEAWLQRIGLSSAESPWEAVIVSERVHGRPHPRVFRVEMLSLGGNHRLSRSWSHVGDYSST